MYERVQVVETGPLFAAAAGDLSRVVYAEVRRIRDEAKTDPRESLKAGLARLVDSELISESEGKILGGIVDQLADARVGKVSSTDAAEAIERAYLGLLASKSPSGVAVAIASLAASAPPKGGGGGVSGADGTPVITARANSNTVDTGIVGGAIIGGALGGALGGFGGAVIGAVVGGIAGGAAAICAD
jgi:hypothetical protein